MEIIINFIISHWEFFITLLPLGILIKKNSNYGHLIKNFQKKLPTKKNRAKEVTASEYKFGTFEHIQVLDTSSHKTSIHQNDIDVFYNELEYFDYKFVFLHKHYKSITKNLERFNPKNQNQNFDIIMVQNILEKYKLGFFEIVWDKILHTFKIKFLKFKRLIN